MEQEFLAKLDAKTQRLVKEIEGFAATEIRVRPTATPLSRSAADLKGITLVASEKGATLLYRDEQDFGPQNVLHELLHLRRYWVDFVAQLLPVEDPDGEKTKIASQIENSLEHLVIVPQEAGYGFDSYSQYNQRARKNWEDYPWPDMIEPWARRKNCLLGWLTARFLVTDADVKKLAEKSLQKEALLDEAKAFSEKIGRLLNSKERCISTAIRFLRIPRQEATMAYLDIRNKNLVKKPIPEH